MIIERGPTLTEESSSDMLGCHSHIPVLHIKLDFIIDQDDLLDFPSSIRQSTKNKDDIARMTKQMLEMDEKEVSRQRVRWKEVVSEIFGPVDESVFDLFL